MPDRPPQKSEQIYELLRRSIILLEMRPGSPILEKELSATYEVSRTPVREALRKLAEEGLVNVLPHSGTYVSQISYVGAEEGFLIRRALEVEGVQKAARLASDNPEILTRIDETIENMKQLLVEGRLGAYLDEDDAFHGAIAQLSGMKRLWKFISMAKTDLDRMRQLSAPVPGHLEKVTEQHVQIAEAIKRGKPQQAELAMRIHLDYSFDVMSNMIGQTQGIFAEEEAK